MQRYVFLNSKEVVGEVIEKNMTRAIKLFNRNFRNAEHDEVIEYRAGVQCGGIKKEGDKWAVYVPEWMVR